MMNSASYTFKHMTHYRFSGLVFLEPHFLRLAPRQDFYHQLTDFSIQFEPQPVGHSFCTDECGNPTIQAWFEGMHKSLKIITSGKVEVFPSNPFDFLPTDALLPLSRATFETFVHPGLLEGTGRHGFSPKVEEFARGIFEGGARTPVEYAVAVCKKIYQSIAVEARPNGPPLDPEITLDAGRGACRDLALVMMDACRCVGLPSRYVSGYFYNGEAGVDRELHAWAEVLLPGGGWRGFDPSHGLATSLYHIPLAASGFPSFAMPVTGSYRGTGIAGTLTSRIELESA